MPQMSGQLELPFKDRGEASNVERSVEASTVPGEMEGSGASGLMERVVSRPNMTAAYKRVRKNKGSPGIDGMMVDELPEWLVVREQLLTGTYRPQPVKRQHIPKAGGGRTTYRELIARGVCPGKAAEVAAHTRRWWKISTMAPHLALPNRLFDELGLPRLAA